MSKRGLLGRNVAIALGITCIILAVGLAGVIANFTLAINDKDDTISSRDYQISGLQAQIADMNNTINNLNLQLADLQDQLIDAISTRDSEISSLEAQIENMNNTIDSLILQIVDLQNQLKAFTGKVLFVTSMGNITIQLFEDMPITTKNFKSIVISGYYDGTIFHRVVRNFVIQGGDLTSKGITWPNITDELPNKHSNVRGSVSMAKTSEANSSTSQFFINLNDTNAASLDSRYSVFGTVINGMDVADAISKVPITPTDASNPDDGQPITPVVLISAEFVS